MALIDEVETMTRFQKVILRFTVALLFALIACTIVSTAIHRLLLPEVRVERGRLAPSGETILLPQSSVHFDYASEPPQAYLFAVEETGSMWGRSYSVHRMNVRYIGEDYLNIEVETSGYLLNASVAVFPSRELYDGDVVTVSLPGGSR